MEPPHSFLYLLDMGAFGAQRDFQAFWCSHDSLNPPSLRTKPPDTRNCSLKRNTKYCKTCFYKNMQVICNISHPVTGMLPLVHGSTGGWPSAPVCIFPCPSPKMCGVSCCQSRDSGRDKPLPCSTLAFLMYFGFWRVNEYMDSLFFLPN